MLAKIFKRSALSWQLIKGTDLPLSLNTGPTLQHNDILASQLIHAFWLSVFRHLMKSKFHQIMNWISFMYVERNGSDFWLGKRLGLTPRQTFSGDQTLPLIDKTRALEGKQLWTRWWDSYKWFMNKHGFDHTKISFCSKGKAMRKRLFCCTHFFVRSLSWRCKLLTIFDTDIYQMMNARD